MAFCIDKEKNVYRDIYRKIVLKRATKSTIYKF